MPSIYMYVPSNFLKFRNANVHIKHFFLHINFAVILWSLQIPVDCRCTFRIHVDVCSCPEMYSVLQLLGGEVFHYHTKLIPKQPRTGGVFQWHQDYGYWYNNGNLTPDLNTVYIAIDRCDVENGCIEVWTACISRPYRKPCLRTRMSQWHDV